MGLMHLVPLVRFKPNISNILQTQSHENLPLVKKIANLANIKGLSWQVLRLAICLQISSLTLPSRNTSFRIRPG